MGSWTLDDIPWHRFDRDKVDPDILAVVKAASLVERDGRTYAAYLRNVFADDVEFCEAAGRWGLEEEQHGIALGRWAQLADDGFDLDRAFARFKAGFHGVDAERDSSVRGSRAGEMIARCMVETGTSSFYSALAEAAEEPVLRAIGKRIAGDELRHYKLFYDASKRHLAQDGLGRWGRLRVGLARIVESEDDELAYAYYAANEAPDVPYDRRRHGRQYTRVSYRIYRAHHIDRGIGMIFKAVGISPTGPLRRPVAKGAWWFVRNRAERLTRAA